jgi:hypothetical protein
MKERSIKDLDKETRDKLRMWFDGDWKLQCPPTWKERCKIDEQCMFELVRKIFIIIDQAWSDYDAHIVSLLIYDFMNDRHRV